MLSPWTGAWVWVKSWKGGKLRMAGWQFWRHQLQVPEGLGAGAMAREQRSNGHPANWSSNWTGAPRAPRYLPYGSAQYPFCGPTGRGGRFETGEKGQDSGWASPATGTGLARPQNAPGGPGAKDEGRVGQAERMGQKLGGRFGPWDWSQESGRTRRAASDCASVAAQSVMLRQVNWRPLSFVAFFFFFFFSFPPHAVHTSSRLFLSIACFFFPPSSMRCPPSSSPVNVT